MSDNTVTVETVRTDDAEVVAFMQQLIDWHAAKVATLQEILDIPPEQEITLVLDGETILATPEIMAFLKMGVQFALAQFGKLPISLSRDESNDEDSDDE